MFKLSIKERNGQMIVKRKLGRNEEVNEREMQVFKSTLIRGLVRPSLEGAKIMYTVPATTTLQNYLRSGINKKEFFVIIAQIIEMTKKIEKYGLNINNLLLNLQYVFVNKLTKEIHFIYQPVINKEVSTSIYAFVNDIAYTAVFELSEDTDFINDFMRFLRDMERYSATEIEQYILKKHPETYKQVKREQPKSTVLKSKAWEFPEDGMTGENTLYAYPEDENDEDDGGTSMIFENQYRYGEEDDDNQSYKSPYSIDLNEILKEDFEEEAHILEEDDDPQTSYLFEEDDPKTTVLNEQIKKYPYLIRLSTYDQIELDKPVFRIGKEKSYVDYFVKNNNAVSRLHADIITKEEQYYIRDNNSTNKTRVNGRIVAPGQMVELYDGDQVLLANESFEFHL